MLRLRKDHGDWRYNSSNAATNEATLLALLGTGSAAQISGGRRLWRHEAAATVLRLRPTELLVKLVPWMLDRFGWAFVRALVRDGTIPRPTDDAYIYGMLDNSIDAATLLREDPALLDHEVWRLFEVEGTSDHSFADHDKYTPDAKTWTRSLLALSAGQIDRDRLLDASLAALERDFPAFRAGWYSRFHEDLMPTPAERAARVDAYLRLLRSPIPPTVTLAVAALTQVQRTGALDGTRLLAHIEPALTSRAAGTARRALRLIEHAVRQEPSLSEAAARRATAALAHASADVQRAAISMFETVLAVDDEVAALLAARRGDVAASVLPRLDAVLAGRPDAAGSADTLGQPPDAPAPTFVRIRRPDRPDPFGSLVPLRPIDSLEGLMELLAGILEREGPPESLELALDGVARFCGLQPPEFMRLTKAVRTRAERLLTGRREPGIATWFAALVRSWVDKSPPGDTPPMPGAVAEYLARRVKDVARDAGASRPKSLVALPSYVGGWIEPTDLVARLAARQRESKLTVGDTLDVAQALLRALPVRREVALASAVDLGGEVGEAVRHAFGGAARIGPTVALWAAAARCRTPDGDDAEVAQAHPGLGADAAIAGRYTLKIGQGRWGREPRLESGVGGPEPRDDVPTDLLWRVSAHVAGLGNAGPLVDWMRLIWPQDRRSWFAVSAALMLDNIDWWEARWHDRQRLEALFEPWAALEREAAMLLAVALQAKEPGERGLAADAAAAAVERGLMAPELLDQGFDEVATALEHQAPSTYPVTLFRPGRLAKSLDAIARQSSLHRAWALEVAAGALVRIITARSPGRVPVGQVTPLLRLILELAAAEPSGIPPSAVPALRSLSVGSGETARLASRLLNDTSTQPA
jgi:hypothetical protein